MLQFELCTVLIYFLLCSGLNAAKYVHIYLANIETHAHTLAKARTTTLG